MEKKKRKYRYSFWKVCLWAALINAFLCGLVLIMIYFIKFPDHTAAIDHKTFPVAHFLKMQVISIAFQSVFNFFALNWYYLLLARRAGWKKYIWPTIALMGGASIYYLISDLMVNPREFHVPALDISMKVFYYGIGALFQIFLPLLIAAITWQLDERKRQAYDQKVLEQRAFKLEKEKMQADYLFLKSQINPHFLHNTLNFLYARSLPYSAELSEAILTLSEIMRYSLDKGEDEGGKVSLTKELEHVRNIIRIQQLRFGNILQVSLTIRGEPDGQRIIPFVLITLVENAFKHGDLKDTEHPIRLELDISGNGRLRFFCSNKKKTGPKELSTGIGLDNTRKRLELAYGENYSLYIKDRRDLFEVDLTITL